MCADITVRRAHVVCGAYPERLLESWDAFKEERGSESPRPGKCLLHLSSRPHPLTYVPRAASDRLPEDQYYMLLFLANAGTDLESQRFDKATGWRQAVDVLWQVADALHAAEQEVEFEVCKMFWGSLKVAEVIVAL